MIQTRRPASEPPSSSCTTAAPLERIHTHVSSKQALKCHAGCMCCCKLLGPLPMWDTTATPAAPLAAVTAAAACMPHEVCYTCLSSLCVALVLSGCYSRRMHPMRASQQAGHTWLLAYGLVTQASASYARLDSCEPSCPSGLLARHLPMRRLPISNFHISQ
jgi:hypothetical protein